MLLPAFDALKMQHDAQWRFMRFQWLDLRRRVLRPALEHGRELAERYQLHLALIDFTNLPPIGLADEMWLSLHWFPRILKLPLQRVALVSRPEHLHNQMAVEAMFWLARYLMQFQVQIFDEVPPALEWLLDGDAPAAQALQHEWHTSVLPTAQPPPF